MININKPINPKYIVVLLIVGFIIGIVLGLFFIKSYIESHTNECVKAFNDCKMKYEACCINGRIGILPFNTTEKWDTKNIVN